MWIFARFQTSKPVSKSTFLCVVALLVAMNVSRALDVRIVIDNTGQNDPVYTGNSRIWNFSISSAGQAAGLQVISGNFAIKDNTSTTEPIVFSIHSGYDGTGAVLGSASLSSSVTTGSFTPYVMDLSSATSVLTAGGYSLVLSSATAFGGNTQYFVKDGGGGGTISMTTTDGTPLDPTYFTNGTGGGGEPVASVPEPGQVAASLLLLGGVVGYWLVGRRGGGGRRAGV